MGTFACIVLLLALLSPVAPLKCYQCFGSSDECRGSTAERQCGEDENMCSNVLANIRIFGNNSTYVYKSCVASDLCFSGISAGATENGFYVMYNISCCQTDLCNGGILPLTHRENFFPNGFSCPGCLSVASEDCSNTDTVICMDGENHCFRISITIKTDPAIGALADTELSLAIRGCGTEQFCELKQELLQEFSGLIDLNITHVECYAAQEILSDHTPLKHATAPNHQTNNTLGNPTGTTEEGKKTNSSTIRERGKH